MASARVLLFALMASAAPVMAQPLPFDMTPESDQRTAPPASETAVPPPAILPAPTPTLSPRTEHHLLPAYSRLSGEEGRSAMVVYLTQAQAAAPARLQLSYLNALVVAPEISTLSIRINNSEVARRPLAASAAPSPIAVDLPAGLLRHGANVVEFFVTQRHRTDCSIQSTYELWTEIADDSALLSFEGAGLGQVRELADLAAIGVDASGDTTIRLIAPALGQPDATRAAIILGQQLALALRVPNLHIEQASELSGSFTPGVLDVVLGTAGQLPASLAQYASQAAVAPVAAIVPQASGANMLLVSGPDWTSVSQAADTILAAAPISRERPRIDLPYPIPTLSGGETFSLAELGLSTMEFNGRRLTTSFQFMLPPDFYANNYGEAELVLDAAYSADVQPGSEIDIYTNTEIASATPLLRTDGGLLRNTVIRFPMTNLRPGRNEVDVVVNLNAQSDAVCTPGWTGNAPVRFVFSSSTQFHMPDYARAAAVPDLQLLTGSAWPYAEDSAVPMVLGAGTDVVISAMSLMARAAAASDRVLPVVITSEAQLRPDQNAMLVMPLSEMSAPILSRSGLVGAAASGAADGADALDQFIGGARQTNPVVGFAEGLLQRAGLKLEDLRVLPQPETPYPVSPGSVVLAQSVQPEGGLWTVLSSSDSASLRSGMERLAVTEQWRQVSGRVSTLLANERAVTPVAANSVVVIQTQPLSLWNLRLVAANWFSGNILLFTGALAAAALMLMLATALVLGRVGRQK